MNAILYVMGLGGGGGGGVLVDFVTVNQTHECVLP